MEREETQVIASLVKRIEAQLIELRGAEMAHTLAVRALIDRRDDADEVRASITRDLADSWPANPDAVDDERALRRAVQKTLKQLGG